MHTRETQIKDDRLQTQIEDPFIKDDLLQMERAENYNKWLFDLVRPWIGKNVLEIGSGTGNFTGHILRIASRVIAVEPNEYCSSVLASRYWNNQNVLIVKKSIEAFNSEDEDLSAVDTAVSINVFEHLVDDISTLRKLRERLPRGSKIILLVPACPEVYGPIDKSVGHFRRYSKKSLFELNVDAGLTIKKLFYSNFPGLLGWWLNSRLSKRTRQNDSQIEVFNRLVPVIAGIEKVTGCAIGLSLISIAEIQ